MVADLGDRGGDSTRLEVTAAAEGVPSLAKTPCAFWNMPEGGTVILGLDEVGGFAPVRITNITALEHGVAAQAREAVAPAVSCEFETVHVAGNPVLAVTVAGLPLSQRLARHRGKAYLRQADGDYEMSEQELAQLELLKTQAQRPTHPDRHAVPGTSAGDLDPGLVASFIAEIKAASRRYAAMSDEALLRYTNVVTGAGELTLVGLYALGIVPQSASPSLGVTAAVQLPRSSTGERSGDLVHLVGPIPDLLDEAMACVVRNPRHSMGYDERGHGREELGEGKVTAYQIVPQFGSGPGAVPSAASTAVLTSRAEPDPAPRAIKNAERLIERASLKQGRWRCAGDRAAPGPRTFAPHEAPSTGPRRPQSAAVARVGAPPAGHDGC